MNSVLKMATSFPGALKAEQDANFARFMTHVLLPIFPEEFWVIRIRVGYVWTGKFDLHTGYVWTYEFFNPERKSFGFKIIPNCWPDSLRFIYLVFQIEGD